MEDFAHDSFLNRGSGSLSSANQLLEDIPSVILSDSRRQYPIPVLRDPAYFNAGFLDLLHDAALVIDPNSYRILAANDLACEKYKFTHEELVGSRSTILWSNAGQESAMYIAVLDKGCVKDFQAAHVKSDGTEISMNINALLTDFDGRQAILSISYDVTERQINEQGMHIARVEWRDTVDAVSDMIILEDPDGRLRRCNRATTDFLGQDYRQLIGQKVDSIIRTGDGKTTEHLRKKIWEGQLLDHEGWFEINSHRVQSHIGTGNRWVHVIKDITKRRLAKKELLKLYSVMEQATDSTIITNLEGRIEYVNAVFEKSIMSGRDACIGKLISYIKPEISLELLNGEVFPYLLQHKFWRVTNKVMRLRDEIFEEVTASRVVDPEGNVINYVFVFRDVTETRQLESIAEAVNTMENVGYVFSGIRHELGNPINSVKMALTVMEKNYDKWDHEQVHVFISRCLQELGRVEYLLRTLKNFSLHEHPHIEEVDLVSFLNHFVSFIQTDFAKRGIKINIRSLLDGETALCDPRALHQVMMNLMANAADALNDREHAQISIVVSENRNRLKVLVADNGTGMSEKQLHNLFKPFYTSKAEGSGLGLVIVRKMLVNMGGTIEIESEFEKGTQVHLTLKASHAEI